MEKKRRNSMNKISYYIEKSQKSIDIRMNNRMFEWYNAIYARKSNNVHAWSGVRWKTCH